VTDRLQTDHGMGKCARISGIASVATAIPPKIFPAGGVFLVYFCSCNIGLQRVIDFKICFTACCTTSLVSYM